MVLGAFWFAAMSLFVRLAGAELATMQIVFLRALFSLALSGALLAHARLSPWGGRTRLLLLRGLLGFVALSCYYTSVVHLPLAEATLVQYTHPVFTALLAALLLREAFGARAALCTLTSLAGVALVARPAALFAGELPFPAWSLAIALAGAVFSAAAYVSVRKLAQEHDPLVVVFYFPLVAAPLALAPALAVWRWPSAAGWLLLVGIGVTTQLGQIHWTRGLRALAAGTGSAIGFVQVVFSALLGLLFLGEVPDAWSLAGAAVILVSVLVLARKS